MDNLSLHCTECGADTAGNYRDNKGNIPHSNQVATLVKAVNNMEVLLHNSKGRILVRVASNTGVVLHSRLGPTSRCF